MRLLLAALHNAHTDLWVGLLARSLDSGPSAFRVADTGRTARLRVLAPPRNDEGQKPFPTSGLRQWRRRESNPKGVELENLNNIGRLDGKPLWLLRFLFSQMGTRLPYFGQLFPVLV